MSNPLLHALRTCLGFNYFVLSVFSAGRFASNIWETHGFPNPSSTGNSRFPIHLAPACGIGACLWHQMKQEAVLVSSPSRSIPANRTKTSANLFVLSAGPLHLSILTGSVQVSYFLANSVQKIRENLFDSCTQTRRRLLSEPSFHFGALGRNRTCIISSAS